MTAVKRNLYLEQGATFILGFVWYRTGTVVAGEVVGGVPYEFDSGTEAVMQIRASVKKPVMVEASTTLGTITLGATPGRVDIVIPADETDKLEGLAGVYDLEIQLSPTNRVRVLQGNVIISPNVTRLDP